jgi:hypothetical protein
VAAGDRAGEHQRGRHGDRHLLRPGRRRCRACARWHADPADGAGTVGPAGGSVRRCGAPLGDRQRGALLPADGGAQNPRRDGRDHLAAGQPGRRRPRCLLRRLRQPHAGTGRSGCRPAKLGGRRGHLSVAAARLGGRAGEPEPGVAGHHLHCPGRPSAPPVALGCRRLPAAARRLGGVRRPRGGDHAVRGRRAAFGWRRLAARLLRERARVRGPAR